jgi:hypothetical protein
MEPQSDPEREEDARESESVQALLTLAEVIPGEDPVEEGALYRDMTTATLQALREPIPQRWDSMNALIERCRVRGWALMFLKDTRGEVQRGIAMRIDSVQAMRVAASGGAPTSPRQVLMMGSWVSRSDPSSSRRMLTAISRQQAAQLVHESGNAPPPQLPDMAELNSLQISALRHNMVREIESAGLTGQPHPREGFQSQLQEGGNLQSLRGRRPPLPRHRGRGPQLS